MAERTRNDSDPRSSYNLGLSSGVLDKLEGLIGVREQTSVLLGQVNAELASLLEPVARRYRDQQSRVEEALQGLGPRSRRRERLEAKQADLLEAPAYSPILELALKLTEPQQVSRQDKAPQVESPTAELPRIKITWGQNNFVRGVEVASGGRVKNLAPDVSAYVLIRLAKQAGSEVPAGEIQEVIQAAGSSTPIGYFVRKLRQVIEHDPAHPQFLLKTGVGVAARLTLFAEVEHIGLSDVKPEVDSSSRQNLREAGMKIQVPESRLEGLGLFTLLRDEITIGQLQEILGPSEKTGKLLGKWQIYWALKRAAQRLYLRTTRNFASAEEQKTWQDIKDNVKVGRDHDVLKIFKAQLYDWFKTCLNQRSAEEDVTPQVEGQAREIIPLSDKEGAVLAALIISREGDKVEVEQGSSYPLQVSDVIRKVCTELVIAHLPTDMYVEEYAVARNEALRKLVSLLSHDSPELVLNAHSGRMELLLMELLLQDAEVLPICEYFLKEELGQIMQEKDNLANKLQTAQTNLERANVEPTPPLVEAQPNANGSHEPVINLRTTVAVTNGKPAEKPAGNKLEARDETVRDSIRSIISEVKGQAHFLMTSGQLYALFPGLQQSDLIHANYLGITRNPLHRRSDNRPSITPREVVEMLYSARDAQRKRVHLNGRLVKGLHGIVTEVFIEEMSKARQLGQDIRWFEQVQKYFVDGVQANSAAKRNFPAD